MGFLTNIRSALSLHRQYKNQLAEVDQARKGQRHKLNRAAQNTRREFLSASWRAARNFGIVAALSGTATTIGYLATRESKTAPKREVPSTQNDAAINLSLPQFAPLKPKIKDLLFDPKMDDPKLFRKKLSNLIPADKNVDETISSLRDQIEKTLDYESKELVTNFEKLSIQLWEETFTASTPQFLPIINSALRKLSSSKRLFVGITITGKNVFWGKIRSEKIIDGKRIIVFKEGASQHDGFTGMSGTNDGLSTVFLMEDELWGVIKNRWENQANNPANLHQKLAKYTFGLYGVSSTKYLKKHKRSILKDFAEFVGRHESGHLKIAKEIGNSHKGFSLPLKLPKNVITSTGDTGAKYFLIMEEFLADLIALKSILSSSKNDAARTKRRLMLFFMALAAYEYRNLNHSIYRSMVFSIIASALSESLQLDLEQLTGAVNLAESLARADLQTKTGLIKKGIKVALKDKFKSEKEKILSKLKEEKVAPKFHDHLVWQSLFLSAGEDRDFTIRNFALQDYGMAEFEKKLLSNRNIVGRYAGRFEWPIKLRDAVLKSFHTPHSPSPTLP